MNKIRTLLVLFVVGRELVGCTENKRKEYFNSPYEVIVHPQAPRVLKGVCIIDGDTLPLFVGWNYIEDKLVCINSRSKDKVFVASDSQGHAAGSFGKIGNSSNEFSKGMDITYQEERGKFWVNDANKAMLMRIDLQASLDSSKCVVDKRVATAGRVLNAFYVNDSTIIYEQEMRDNYRLYVFDAKRGKARQHYDLYSPCKENETFNVYRTYMQLHPDAERLVGVMANMNQVNFLSATTNKRKAVSLYEEAELCYDYEKQTYFYCGVTATRNRVYALYLDQCSKESFEKAKPVEVHVFDWDGNFIERLRINEYLCGIAVDERGKNLYGAEIMHNHVYKYKL